MPANRVKLLPPGPAPKPSLSQMPPAQPGSSYPAPEHSSEDHEVRAGILPTLSLESPETSAPTDCAVGSICDDPSWALFPHWYREGVGRCLRFSKAYVILFPGFHP